MEERIDVAAPSVGGLAGEFEDRASRWIWHLLRHVECDESEPRPVRVLARYQCATYERFRRHLADRRSEERHLPGQQPLPDSCRRDPFRCTLPRQPGIYGARGP